MPVHADFPTPPPADDPRPVEPEKPLPADCCDGGCSPCVLDLYAEAMAHYREHLAQWLARHPGAN